MKKFFRPGCTNGRLLGRRALHKGGKPVMKIDASKLRDLVKSHGLTNAKLAAKAGITRQAIHGIFKDGGIVKVRDRTVKGLARALRLPDETLLSPDPLARYKEAVAKQHA